MKISSKRIKAWFIFELIYQIIQKVVDGCHFRFRMITFASEITDRAQATDLLNLQSCEIDEAVKKTSVRRRAFANREIWSGWTLPCTS